MRRLLVLFMISSLLVLPVMAGESAPPDQVLKGVLELDDQQLAELQKLMESRRAAFTDATKRLGSLREQLEAALSQSTPDPAAVGSLVLSIRAVERDMAQHQENFRNTFLGILSEEQRQRVETFRFIRAAFLGGTALDELGL